MELFHVLNRGVEKRQVVLDDKDRLRFVHDLFVFNDRNQALNYILPGRHTLRPRKLLVHIHAFCLMPNHYHLLLSNAIENGVPLFMKKLNMGYAKYFNEKYDRSGALWQGKYKRIRIERDAHLLYIPYYIHLNPLDISFPQWREGKIQNISEATEYLQTYRWSSYLDYMGVHNFPSITHRGFLADMLGTQKKQMTEIRNIVGSPELAHSSLSIE